MKSDDASHKIPSGGWFGALIGSAAWIPLFVGFQIGQYPLFAIANLVFCLVCVVCGIVLWFEKNRFPRSVCLQLLLLISFLPSAATIVSTVCLKISDAKPSLLWVLLIYPYAAVFLLWMSKLQTRRNDPAVEGRQPSSER